MRKGFALDDEHLKNPGGGYCKELLEMKAFHKLEQMENMVEK